MRQHKSLGFVALLLAATAGWIGMPASAATAEEVQPIAEVRITPGGVDWLPLGEDQGFTLTVAGPQGVVVYREFAAGEVPSIGLVDQEGRALPDGTYGYELRPLAPATGVERPRFISGYLTVRDASFVVPVARPEVEAGGSGAGPGATAEVPTPAALGVVVLDEELIVDDRVCIGDECIEGNSETNSHGLTLKSIGPLMVFDDVFEGFSPHRDWAIQINAFPVGGLEFFKIRDLGVDFVDTSEPFTLSGSAPDHSLFVDPSGNVGLGTSVPSSRLHLFGNPTDDVFVGAGPNGPFPTFATAFNFGYGGASFGRGAGFLNARPDASATAPNPSLRFLTADVERMIVTNTGNVGVGTSAPEAPVHAKHTASGLTMQLEAAGDVYLREKNSVTGRFVDINFINDEFRVNIEPSALGPELRLTNTGNLIIRGTYTPDYVFEPDYPLMPLAELAEFVAREKHLPNVPNAAEVAEQGISVNVFPMQLLEKIEELTLYAIAQQETIDELRARLEAVEQRDAASSEP